VIENGRYRHIKWMKCEVLDEKMPWNVSKRHIDLIKSCFLDERWEKCEMKAIRV